MKRRITLSIALVLSIVLVSLMSSDSMVKAEPPQRFDWDTGLVKVGVGQTLLVTVATGDIIGDGTIAVRFRRLEYMQTACDDGVCRQVISAQTASAPMIIPSNEAASVVAGNLIGTDVTRVIVTTNSRNVRVNAALIDVATGETQVLIALLLP